MSEAAAAETTRNCPSGLRLKNVLFWMPSGGFLGRAEDTHWQKKKESCYCPLPHKLINIMTLRIRLTYSSFSSLLCWDRLPRVSQAAGQLIRPLLFQLLISLRFDRQHDTSTELYVGLTLETHSFHQSHLAIIGWPLTLITGAPLHGH